MKTAQQLINGLRMVYNKTVSDGRHYENFDTMDEARRVAETLRDQIVEAGITTFDHAWDFIYQQNTRVWFDFREVQVNSEEEEEAFYANGVDETVDDRL
jgi:RNA recognition motif-containing protein